MGGRTNDEWACVWVGVRERGVCVRGWREGKLIIIALLYAISVDSIQLLKPLGHPPRTESEQ